LAYHAGELFEWDPGKARTNERKHGVTFEEARSLFTSGVDFLEIYDEGHDESEDRFIAIGPVQAGVICVVFVEREEDTIRILSARHATRRERRMFDSTMRGEQP